MGFDLFIYHQRLTLKRYGCPTWLRWEVTKTAYPPFQRLYRIRMLTKTLFDLGCFYWRSHWKRDMARAQARVKEMRYLAKRILTISRLPAKEEHVQRLLQSALDLSREVDHGKRKEK